MSFVVVCVFFFQAEDGIRDLVRSRGLGDVYKRQQLMLPILLPLSASMGTDPLQLMVPATLAASFGYMLPVATAANTIVYGTGYIPVKSMMRTGFLLNVCGILLLTLLMHVLHF